MEEVQGVKWCVSREAGFILEATGEDLCVELGQFCCTVVKCANLLLRMRRGCVEVERRMIRMMCGVRLVDRVSTEVLRDRVGVVVKIEDMITQSRQGWYDHAIDIIVIDMIMIMTLNGRCCCCLKI